MKISDIIKVLTDFAPLAHQESYDNTGLLVGYGTNECTGVLCTLDATEAVILEAQAQNCNLIVAHHPIIFGGLKKITGSNYVERSIITAIKKDIAIFALHTNLDNIITGVNNKIADQLGLVNRTTLRERPGTLMKLNTFVPDEHVEMVKNALFKGGGGKIGNYSECSFTVSGTGTFKPGDGSDPYIGKTGLRHLEKEVKIEVIFPAHLQKQIVSNLIEAHPYEEVAYDIISLTNRFNDVGSGLTGELTAPVAAREFLSFVADRFRLQVIRHTPFLNKAITKVAVCGGAGSFLTPYAIEAGADIFITADVKYHEFFDADDKIIIADIGHFESEQYTIELLHEVLHLNFPTFALLKSQVKTNPVNYFFDK